MPPINPYAAPGATYEAQNASAPYGASGPGAPAPLGLRLVAQGVNAFAYAVTWLATFVVLCGINGVYLGARDLPVEVDDRMLAVILTSCALAGVIPHAIFLAVWRQSMGKWVAHTRVVSRDGRDASMRALFARAIALQLSLFALLGCPPFGIVALLFLLSDEHRGLHERLTNTAVVRAPR